MLKGIGENTENMEFMYQTMEKYCIHFNIRNIRILQRTERYLRDIFDKISQFDTKVQEQIFVSTIVFHWSFLNQREQFIYIKKWLL